MPYVERDAQNKITGKTRWPDVDHAEFVADNDPDYLEFLNPTQAELIEAALAGTESVAQVARKIEDVIELLDTLGHVPVDSELKLWKDDRATKRQST